MIMSCFHFEPNLDPALDPHLDTDSHLDLSQFDLDMTLLSACYYDPC